MISQKLLEELKEILKTEFNCELKDKDLNNFASNLIGYFELLIKINNKYEND